MSKTQIQSTNAPAAIGPYSQAIRSGNSIYVSGQLPINPGTGSFPEGQIKEQTEQSLKNIAAILEAAGCSMDNVVKTTVYLADISDFNAMNEVYAKYFQGVCPARAAFQVAALPKGALVEIEAIASAEE
ncbi:MAG: RidA family protein [Lachnospiraceae bacterium]|nr:RidA family protein [Lachnospiraceae bacterium]